MKILIAATLPPYGLFVEKDLVRGIESILSGLGHETDTMFLPFTPDDLSTLQQFLPYRLLRVESTTDLLITVGYPAFALRFPRKICFLTGLSASYHEHYNTVYGALWVPQNARRIENTRSALWHLEKKSLLGSEKVYCASRALQTELWESLQIPSEPFAFSPPPRESTAESDTDTAPYFLSESALLGPDRIDLLLDALRQAEHSPDLRLYVPNAPKMYRKGLEDGIARRHLESRVHVFPSYAPQSVILGARAVVSCAYGSMSIPSFLRQAQNHRIPVVCPSDAGALTELFPGREKELCDPSAQSVGEVLERLDSMPRRPAKKRKTGGISSLESILQEVGV